MILQIENLVKRYKDLLALDNLNLNISEGEIFGLLGPNGAGKTTAIKCLTGLISYDSGSIKLFGKDLKLYEKEIKRQLGIVPQDLSLYYDLTPYENLDLFGNLYDMNKITLKNNIEKVLNMTDLWEKKDTLSKELSGGMLRRLNIACALVHNPSILIMDEPTIGIDVQSKNKILEFIKSLNKEGITIIYTSHNMEEVEELCSNIAIIDNGRVIAKGNKEELLDLIDFEEKIGIKVSSMNYSFVNLIKQISQVKECDVIGNNLNIILTKKGRKELGNIINMISQNESSILDITIERPNLERVFLTLTGRELK